MKKLFLALIMFSASAFADDVTGAGMEFDNSDLFKIDGKIDQYAILHVESTTGNYVEIKQHDDGTIYIKTNQPLDAAAKQFFDQVVKDNILPRCATVTQKDLTVKGNNVGLVLDGKQKP